MDIKFRILLILATIFIFFVLIKNVKRGKLRSDYALGWILASIFLVIISVFPQIVYWISSWLGILSPANAIFMFIIFLLIVLVYVLFSKVSMLEEKQKDLIQELAFFKKEISDKSKEK